MTARSGKSFISALLGKKRCPYHEPKPYQGHGGHRPINTQACNCDKPIPTSKGSGSRTSQDID